MLRRYWSDCTFLAWALAFAGSCVDKSVATIVVILVESNAGYQTSDRGLNSIDSTLSLGSAKMRYNSPVTKRVSKSLEK